MASDDFDLLFFDWRGHRCALPTAQVIEVADIPSVTPIPLSGGGIRGVIPYRGHPIALVEVGKGATMSQATAVRGGDVPGPAGMPARDGETLMIVLQARVPGVPIPVTAALPVERVLTVARVNRDHNWRDTHAGGLFSAELLGPDGPTLFMNASAALQQVMALVQQGPPS